MGIQVYGVRFICDLCGVTADGPTSPSGMIRYDEHPRPDGWTAMFPDWTVRLTDMFGSELQHLCPMCGALSIGGLVERLKAKAKERAAKN